MIRALIAAARAARAAWSREREAARAMAELSRLDDAQLADLGIDRAGIEAYAHGRHPVQRRPRPAARPALRLVTRAA
jgi:uncharacterized protein YjiS (DUF1127 family)